MSDFKSDKDILEEKELSENKQKTYDRTVTAYKGRPFDRNKLIVELIDQISDLPTPEEEPMTEPKFETDVVVIGAGPGGYVSAIRAAQLGAKVVCVEKEYLGGTCLNWGCIPSKAMIASVERLHQIKHAESMGIKVDGDVSIDFDAFMNRKNKIVTTLRGGIGMLFKKNGIRHLEGFAKFVDKNTLEVTNKDGAVEKIQANKFILAMGSSVIRLNIPGLEGATAEDGVWTSDDAIHAPFVPESMLVLGGGAVGCELGYVFNGLGSKVTLLEMMPNLIPTSDSDLGKELEKLLKRSGMNIHAATSLEKCEKTAKGWKCTIKKGDQVETVEVQVVLLGVGRKANTDGMNLEGVGVKLHGKGVEVVDQTLRTHTDNIFAIGDCIGNIQLAHVASCEGLVAASNAVKNSRKEVNYKAVPSCIYTVPEVASVGLSEQEAKDKGYDVKTGKFAFRALGKAMAIAEPEGFVKVVIDNKYGEVLGVHMIGAHVTDMIQEGVVALKHEATLESMLECIHAHPTMCEAVLEAFEDAAGHAVHKM